MPVCNHWYACEASICFVSTLLPAYSAIMYHVIAITTVINTATSLASIR